MKIEKKNTRKWWQDSSRIYLAISLPVFSLRRGKNDPGVGKFTDLGRYFKEKLSKKGVTIILLLPHFAILNESPYAPVSLYAINELFIDWSIVPELQSAPELMKFLVSPSQKVNYPSVKTRENKIAKGDFRRFKLFAKGTKRENEYQKFVKHNDFWLRDFADFIALHKILKKSSLNWSEKEVKKIRKSPRYQELVGVRKFSQWIGFLQLKETIEKIHKFGGRILLDIPMFRAKDSVDVWKFPGYFKDIKTRNPGIVRQDLNENWKDLALWNWTELGKQNYSFLLAPIEYWLKFGFDGARYDGLHFAYNFGKGQLISGDEPGDDFVARLAELFSKYEAFPLAEAFEGKAEDIKRHGFVTLYGDWKHLSSHDDPRQYKTAKEFKQKFRELLYSNDYSGKNARFISYTIGDDWGDPELIKVKEKGKTYWRYRIPLKKDPNYKARVLFDMGPYMSLMISGGRKLEKLVQQKSG